MRWANTERPTTVDHTCKVGKWANMLPDCGGDSGWCCISTTAIKAYWSQMESAICSLCMLGCVHGCEAEDDAAVNERETM